MCQPAPQNPTWQMLDRPAPPPRIALPHGCDYWLISVPTNPGGWSSREIPSPRPIRRLCRSHSLMFETDRTHTKCMCDLSEEKMFSADFVVFSPSRGPQVLCRAKIPRATPAEVWTTRMQRGPITFAALCLPDNLALAGTCICTPPGVFYVQYGAVFLIMLTEVALLAAHHPSPAQSSYPRRNAPGGGQGARQTRAWYRR